MNALKVLNLEKFIFSVMREKDDHEKELVGEVRASIEQAIDWDCSIIKNYAAENRGVYVNIALGAKWVFRREKWAIFLEDDNLPEISFFQFCQEMLQRYEKIPEFYGFVEPITWGSTNRAIILAICSQDICFPVGGHRGQISFCRSTTSTCLLLRILM